MHSWGHAYGCSFVGSTATGGLQLLESIARAPDHGHLLAPLHWTLTPSVAIADVAMKWTVQN